MCEEAKEGRTGGKDEGNDVKEECIGDPLDDHGWNFDWEIIADKCVYVLGGND